MAAMKLGIFGGTFNPIHLGHLLLAETARETLALDRVLFIPTHQPPHKSAKHLLPGALRLKLIQLAIRDHPAFVASDIELQRAGPSYSIETVQVLHRRLPDATLVLLIGQDMLTVPWVGWKELTRLCTIAVAPRPETAPAPRARSAHGPRRTTARPPRGAKWLPMPPLAITSSDIRARIKAGRSIRYLVPTAVARFIHSQQLYRTKPAP
jgi:nicotinate-nucleotide adenylyltransferase